MSTKRHVVITGTGRAGTTLLVELLTHLGLETGFTTDSIERNKSPLGRAGLEHNLSKKDCPYIVKSPAFCDHASKVFGRDDIVVEHIFIPMRDLKAAAESRRYVSEAGASELSSLARFMHMIRPRRFRGGLCQTNSNKPGDQELILLRKIYGLMLSISDEEIPVTFIRYPRLTRDSPYLFSKLRPILQGISYKSFCDTFNAVVRPELVHSFNENDC